MDGQHDLDDRLQHHHCDRTLHAEIIDIPERAGSEQPRDLTTLPTSSAINNSYRTSPRSIRDLSDPKARGKTQKSEAVAYRA